MEGFISKSKEKNHIYKELINVIIWVKGLSGQAIWHDGKEMIIQWRAHGASNDRYLPGVMGRDDNNFPRARVLYKPVGMSCEEKILVCRYITWVTWYVV